MARLRGLVGLSGLVGLLGLSEPFVLAQGQAPFTPATTSESISGGTLLLVAYGLAWAIVLLLYVFMIWRKSRRVEQELADVTAKLNARPAKR